MKTLTALLVSDLNTFAATIKEELGLLLRDCVQSVSLNPPTIPSNVELDLLNWIFSIRRLILQNGDRHKARLVNASHRSALFHSVHGNAPTIALHWIRTFASVLLTWISLQPLDSPISIFCRDVTKAFQQSDRSDRLIIYQTPSEFFKLYPLFHGHVWHALA